MSAQNWSGKAREFRQVSSKANVKIWTISVKGNEIHKRWGLQGGKMQEVVEKLNGVNIGKKNEVSPEAYALDRAEETIHRKVREGYREYDASGNLIGEVVETTIDFDNLPESLCFYKPDNSMSVGMEKKAAAGKVWYGRKRNGLMYVIVKGSGAPQLYSRRMLKSHHLEANSGWTWNHRFPHIVGAADKIMPPNSMFIGELVRDKKGVDDFKYVTEVEKNLTPGSIELQAKDGALAFYIWDVAFWDGQDMVSKLPVKSRYEFIHDLELEPGVLLPVEFYEPTAPGFETPEKALVVCEKKGWEGFVVVDPEGIYGEKAYNFKGKPDRPRSDCAKLKPIHEDDFIVIWNPKKNQGEYSTKERYAKNGKQGIESVALYQYDKKGDLVFISFCSSGMTEDMKRDLADPKHFPQVWTIKYTDRTYIAQGDDTNALTFPRFFAVRTDKAPEECINQDL